MPLMMACITGELENVRYLMLNGADRSVASSIGKTAISGVRPWFPDYSRPQKSKSGRAKLLVKSLAV